MFSSLIAKTMASRPAAVALEGFLPLAATNHDGLLLILLLQLM
jgi:hypothetical protein